MQKFIYIKFSYLTIANELSRVFPKQNKLLQNFYQFNQFQLIIIINLNIISFLLFLLKIKKIRLQTGNHNITCWGLEGPHQDHNDQN